MRQKIQRRVLSILLVALCVSACQPTPTEQPEPMRPMDFAVVSDTVLQRTETLSDGILLHLDAFVEVPEAPLPCGEYLPEPLTKESIGVVYHALCGDAQPLRYAETVENLYDYVAYGREMLALFEDKISDENRAYEEQLLSELLANAANAPQKKEKADVSDILVYPDKIIQANLGKNWDASFQVWTEPHNMLYFRNFGVPVPASTELKLTEEGAVEAANRVLDELGIKDDFGVADIHTEAVIHSVFEQYLEESDCSKGYRILYLRKINGVEQIYLANLTHGIPREYNYDFQQEYIEFLIDDTGILSFQWQSPGKIVVSSDRAQVISLSDAAEIAIQRLKHSYHGLTFKSADPGDIHICIDRIELGCGCIPAENNRVEILPVWEFFGRIENHTEDDVKYYDRYTGFWREDYAPDESLVTVNAMNGQVVDRVHQP